mmetsp:Transcript_32856/g.29721  ORF Transcript_32856/g.29721 Transcript_32856/m.29721 type:complete len:182 (-) Transcript_32856:1474-2019(-)
MLHNTNNVYVTDQEIDIETKKILGSENIISKNQLKEAHVRITNLQNELKNKEELFYDRERELKIEIDKMRAAKTHIEALYGGIDLDNMKKQDEELKKVQQTLENNKVKYESEIKDLKAKLNWYVENQDSLATMDEKLKEKDRTIKKLEEDLNKLMIDPNNLLEDRDRHIKREMNNDKKRIK